MEEQEKRLLSESWWFVLLRGIFTLIAGVIFLAWPAMSVFSLTIILGVWALVTGAIDSVASLIRIGKHKFSWLMFLGGLLSIIVGIMILRYPMTSIVVLYQLFALWAVITGITQVVMGLFFKSLTSTPRWLIVTSGILSLLLGVILLSNVLAGFIAITWLLGIYGIVVGIFLSVFSFQVRSMQKQVAASTAVVQQPSKKVKKSSKK